MLSRAETSLLNYWGQPNNRLDREVKELGYLINPESKNNFSKFIEPLLEYLMSIFSFGSASRQEEKLSAVSDFIDQITKTELSTCPLNKTLNEIKENSNEYLEALKSKKPEQKAIESLHKLQKNLQEISKQVEVNKLLAQGRVEEFNALKRNNPKTIFYIKDQEVFDKDLSGLDLSNCVIENTVFRSCDMNKLNVKNSSFKNVRFFVSILRNSRFSVCDFDNTVFEVVKTANSLKQSKTINPKKLVFDSCNFRSSSFTDSDLFGFEIIDSHLKDSGLIKSRLSDAEINNSQFRTSKLESVKGHRLKITDSKFSNSLIKDLNLRDSIIKSSLFNQETKINKLGTYLGSYNSYLTIEDSRLDDVEFQRSDLTRSTIKDLRVTGSKLKNIQFTTSYIDGLTIEGSGLDGVKFKNGNPEDKRINIKDCEEADYEFLEQDRDIKQVLEDERIAKEQAKQREKLLRSLSRNVEERRKLLFSNPEDFSFLSPKEVFKYTGMNNKKLLNRFDPDIKTRGEDSVTLLHRLHIIDKVRIIAKSLAPTSTKKDLNDDLEKLLYESVTRDTKSNKEARKAVAEESKLLQRFSIEDLAEINDAIDEVIDYLLIPRIAMLVKDEDIERLTASRLDKITRDLQPALAFALISERDFSRVPKSAAHKGPSLLARFSQDIHEPRNNFTGAIREFAPQGGWHQILEGENSVLIEGSDGHQYEVVNLLTSADFKKESDVHGHCIGRGMHYVNRAKSGNYHYFSIQDAKTKQKISTLELSLSPHTNKSGQVRIHKTNYSFKKLQNQGSTRNGRRPGIGNEIANTFLKAIENGSVQVKTPYKGIVLGDKFERFKASPFENHIGMLLGIHQDTGTRGVVKTIEKAWARLARPTGVYLDNKFGFDENGERYTSAEAGPGYRFEKLIHDFNRAQAFLKLMRSRKDFSEAEIEKQAELVIESEKILEEAIKNQNKKITHEDSEKIKSTSGIGSYNQAKDSPFDNFFIPNLFRGIRDSESGIFREYPDKSRGPGKLTEGAELFFTKKIIGLDKSFDEMILDAVEKYAYITR